jgi:hypothetical protein
LVTRHNDPDDDFDLNELTDAMIFTDPDQIERVERLFATEQSSFSPVAGFTTSGTGALTGLRPR